MVFVLENALNVIMSQAVQYLRQPQLSSRDKQLLKRELSTELVSAPSGGQSLRYISLSQRSHAHTESHSLTAVSFSAMRQSTFQKRPGFSCHETIVFESRGQFSFAMMTKAQQNRMKTMCHYSCVLSSFCAIN